VVANSNRGLPYPEEDELNFDISQLRPEEKAALAKAQAVGVNVVQSDGSTVDVSKQTPPVPVEPAKATPAAAESGDVAPVKGAENTSATSATDADKPQKPAHVPDKFWDAEKGVVNTEALLKSYGELERARSASRPQEIPQPATMGQTPATGTTATPGTEQTSEQKASADAAAAQAAQQAAEAKLVADRSAASADANADISRDGKISDATYTKLAAVGYDRATVDQYVAGLQATATLQLNEMHNLAGGKADFDKMVEWGAAGGYTADEAKAFDEALRSGDKGKQALAVNGLKARYASEFGSGRTTTVNTNNGSNANHNAFKSQAEFLKATSDARYAKDASYRAEVAQRIAASQRAGIDIGIRVQR
jgi:hypothetical protein